MFIFTQAKLYFFINPKKDFFTQENNQLTVTSISQLSGQHPGNDPDSMVEYYTHIRTESFFLYDHKTLLEINLKVAFLPHVRRNTMEKIPEQTNNPR